MNLFLSTQRLAGSSKEGHLTEFFAAALNLNEQFRSAYADIVLGAYAIQKEWCNHRIESVDTQISCEDKKCRPDMLLVLENGEKIICEHKIEASETQGFSEETGDDPTPQLKRYLTLGFDGLVYVRASCKSPEKDVMENPQYIRPKNRAHFLWEDFYPMFAGITDPFIAWIREGFEKLGFTPPNRFIGDLRDPDDETREKNRKNFWKLWENTIIMAEHLGWKANPGYICQIYLSDNPTAIADQIFISPDFNRLLIRVTPPTPEENEEVLNSLSKVAESLEDPPEVGLMKTPRAGGPVTVCDVVTPLDSVISASVDANDIRKRLQGYVEPFLRSLIINHD